jgi:hypothetical protein
MQAVLRCKLRDDGPDSLVLEVDDHQRLPFTKHNVMKSTDLTQAVSQIWSEHIEKVHMLVEMEFLNYLFFYFSYLLNY